MAKLGDYGLAKAFDMAGLSGHTCPGEVAGTPQFMPRQQVLGFKEMRPEADVWAMAATFYNMLTGCYPRDFPDGRDPWPVILETAAVPIRQRNPAIPPRLADGDRPRPGRRAGDRVQVGGRVQTGIIAGDVIGYNGLSCYV